MGYLFPFIVRLYSDFCSSKVHLLKIIIDLDEIHQQNSVSILRHLKVNVLFFKRFLKPILSFSTLHINLVIFHTQICVLSVIIDEQKSYLGL